ncbi:MAG: hypothetical protein BGN97_04465 [Microbacterium sp. 69-10]|nr:MAG: hypothetical protein BGN97_04465 [Microbacterium sp. 69-10]
MDILDGNEPANTIDTEINKSRDYIAQRTAAVTPIEKGGTGQTTAPAALAALGGAARNGLGFTYAVAQLSDHQLGLYYNDAAQRFVIRKTLDGSTVDIPLATDGAYVSKSGDTMTGDLRLPNATPATSGYTVAYLNSDGRVSKGASSERYKQGIVDIDPGELGDIFPDLVSFEMIGGDGARHVGHIAERLAANPDQQPFVVYTNLDGQTVPDSIDFIALLLAQTAQLHQAVDLLAQRVQQLEERAA